MLRFCQETHLDEEHVQFQELIPGLATKSFNDFVAHPARVNPFPIVVREL